MKKSFDQLTYHSITCCLLARRATISTTNREKSVQIKTSPASRTSEAVLVEPLAVKRNEFATEGLGTRSTSRTSLVCARLTDWPSLVLDKSTSQLAATLVAGEAIRMPVLTVCCENCFRNNIVATIAAMSINTVRVKGVPLLDDVLICDTAPALGAWHQVANTVCAVRLTSVVIERPTKLSAASRAIKVIGMPAPAKSGQVLAKDPLATFGATVR